MRKIREYNEQEALKLDECFKETLARVRPFVLNLTSAESAQLCKVWLDKLSTASAQRRLRNEYLLELCRQLKIGRIEGIFSRPPPNGLLLPLPKSYHMVCISSSVSDLSDYVVRPQRSCLKPSAKCVQHQRSAALLKQRLMDTTGSSRCVHPTKIPPTVRFHSQDAIRNSRINIHEQRINTLSAIIAELQAQNEYLKKQLLEWPGNHSSNMDNHLSASISQLTSDVTTLKAKLIDMQRKKSTLETDYKEVVQEYRYEAVEQVTALKQELEETRLKNESLDNNIIAIMEKLEEIIHGKEEETKLLEQHWMNKIKAICDRFDTFTEEKSRELQKKEELLEKKDLELLQIDAGRKEETALLINKINDLEIKLEMKIKDEDKLQAMLVEQHMMMKEEFNKIRNEIDRETQIQNQSLISKVSALKKAVAKLEKSKEKLEHDYEKKMALAIKNKDLEIKALQLRLQEQRNEMCTSLSMKKQSEMDNIVALLEKQYRTRLAGIEAMSETQTQEYLRRIAELEDQVLSAKKVRPMLVEQ